MNPITIAAQQLRQAANIQEKIQSLQEELNQILGVTVESTPSEAPKKRRKMSAAGRRAIAAAAKTRWAKFRAVKGEPFKKAKRKLTAAGRAALSAAAKAGWAKARKAGKSRL